MPPSSFLILRILQLFKKAPPNIIIAIKTSIALKIHVDVIKNLCSILNIVPNIPTKNKMIAGITKQFLTHKSFFIVLVEKYLNANLIQKLGGYLSYVAKNCSFDIVVI